MHSNVLISISRTYNLLVPLAVFNTEREKEREREKARVHFQQREREREKKNEIERERTRYEAYKNDNIDTKAENNYKLHM